MTRIRHHRLGFKRRQGFTLVELVIVGALIALFSSLAVFSIQQQYRSNVRKATIGEARNLAVALDFANIDTSIFPKLFLLTESEQGLEFVTTQLGLNSTNVGVFATADIAQRAFDPVGGARVKTQWNGPYFAISQARTGISQGRGGISFMLDPLLPQVGPNDVSQPGGLRWPSDPYNNPYVVYMLDVEDVASTPRLQFVTQELATGQSNPNRKGNFVNAVVSYGSNQIPGGEDFESADFGTRNGGNGDVELTGNGPWAARLYKGVPGFSPVGKGAVTYTYLRPNEFTDQRANVWNRQFAVNNGAAGFLPASGVGITDINSDDIVYEF